ncbi:hypothetical protein PybrP1_006632, partial [[Pythium] brassicae (nom. inval.)]
MAEHLGDDDDMAAAAARAALGLARLVPDALEDSHVAAYSLLVVAPLCALAARLLRARGKASTFPQVLLVALLVPGLLLGVPAMQRTESKYAWGQKYAFLRSLFQRGEMPAHVWHQVDSAYDCGVGDLLGGARLNVVQQIYNDKQRVLYDFWGPDAAAMSLAETQLNVGLFYVLWAAI